LAVVIGLYLGLRRFEIAKLRWADFDDGWLRVVGKGDVEATIPVHPVVTAYLDRLADECAFVFPGSSGGSVCPATIWNWVREVSQEAGLPQVTTHVLRHTALATGNDETGDLRSAQDFARHAEPGTTSGYTRSTKRRLVAFSDAIGDFYGRPREDADPSEGPVGFAPGAITLADIVRLLDGPHAVAPWIDLQTMLEGRPGWRLDSVDDGSCMVAFMYSPASLSIDVRAPQDGRRPSFSITRVVGPTIDDIAWWELDDVDTLGALLSTFEAGGIPFPPTGSLVSDQCQSAQ
jgi:hypothetical protein